MLEIHAVDTGDQRRWQEGYRRHGKYLDYGILLDVDQTLCGIKQEVDLAGEESCVIGDRGDVAGQRLDARLGILR